MRRPTSSRRGLLSGSCDSSNFLGRSQPSKTTIQETPDTLGVEESSSPRRVLCKELCDDNEHFRFCPSNGPQNTISDEIFPSNGHRGGGVLGETRVDMVATGPLHQPGGMDMAPSVVHCVNTSARQYINVHLTVHSRHVTAHSLWYVVSLLFLAVCHGSRHAIAAALSL